MVPKTLKIGPLSVEPPLVQAPMAGFTNYAFRQLVRRLGGAGLLTTEMLSARGVLEMEARREDLPERLWGVRDEPRPLAVQIWDNDPAKLAAVGRRLAVEFRASVVDINFGCPARDVAEKAQSGSYLLQFPDRVGRIVATVVAACSPVPVTAKIRLGLTRDAINAGDVAEAVESAGGAALTVHGRTAADGFRGSADWSSIAAVRPRLRRIPLIGNGDIKTPQGAAAAFDRYGVDGVMIGRAALSRPWLFRQCRAALLGEPIPPEPTLDQQRELLLDHYRWIVEQFGDRDGTVLMRRYACCYAQGCRGARAFRNRISRVSTPGEFRRVVDRDFPCEQPAASL
jgi:tRNA-dihydrouridine synthase B